MRPVRIETFSGKSRLVEKPAARTAGWQGDLWEIVFVAAVWVLALVQVGIVVARGGAWTPDSTLALAFALACPLALREFRSGGDAAD